MNLQDRVCVVTGAAGGIGFALATELLACGALIALTDHDQQALDFACADLPTDRHLALLLDVTEEPAFEVAIQAVLSKWGRLDVWINNAGVARHQPIHEIGEREIDLMLGINTKGTILGSKHALLHMREQKYGHIVNILSTAALNGVPGQSVYCASKFAVRGFNEALQEEAAPYNVRVTAVFPGGVDTAFWDHAREGTTPVELFLSPGHIARGVVNVLQMDDFCVTREIVLRSIRDVDTVVPVSDKEILQGG